jgi:drug/metabolite transporter (DMT)-like permease
MISLKGYVFIIGAALFWGVSATVAKFLFSQQVDTLVLVQMRMTLSCLVLLVFFLIFRRDLLRVKLKDLYRFALLGIIGGAGSNFMYYFTIKETNVATAILLQYTAPLLVLAYAAVTREEELSISKIIAGIVSLGGCFLAVGGEHFSLSNISRLGLLSGAGSAICWAFTNISLRHILREYKVWTTLVYSFLFASIFWLFFNSPVQVLAANYSSATWEMFFGFAMISILIPHSFYFLGIRHLTASRAIITATVEPIVAIVSAFIFLQEVLLPVQLAGAVLVIAAIGILQLKQDESQELQPGPETSVREEKSH